MKRWIIVRIEDTEHLLIISSYQDEQTARRVCAKMNKSFPEKRHIVVDCEEVDERGYLY